jgi:hypothetical protein
MNSIFWDMSKPLVYKEDCSMLVANNKIIKTVPGFIPRAQLIQLQNDHGVEIVFMLRKKRHAALEPFVVLESRHYENGRVKIKRLKSSNNLSYDFRAVFDVAFEHKKNRANNELSDHERFCVVIYKNPDRTFKFREVTMSHEPTRTFHSKIRATGAAGVIICRLKSPETAQIKSDACIFRITITLFDDCYQFARVEHAMSITLNTSSSSAKAIIDECSRRAIAYFKDWMLEKNQVSCS